AHAAVGRGTHALRVDALARAVTAVRGAGRPVPQQRRLAGAGARVARRLGATVGRGALHEVTGALAGEAGWCGDQTLVVADAGGAVGRVDGSAGAGVGAADRRGAWIGGRRTGEQRG